MRDIDLAVEGLHDFFDVLVGQCVVVGFFPEQAAGVDELGFGVGFVFRQHQDIHRDGGAERKIRKYLVDSNFIETIIALPPNLFFGTSIAVNILVLSKHKTDTNTQFIDASALFKKETNNNVLTDSDDVNNPGHIQQIMQVFANKQDVAHFARSVPLEDVAANGYNLSVSSYVEAKDTREVVDISQLNAELKTTVARIDQLRREIDAIVAEIEGEEAGA